MTEREIRILDQCYNGTEACPECGFETDFKINPLKKIRFRCSHCGYEMLPCSLCNTDYCGGKCEDVIKKSLIEYNSESED